MARVARCGRVMPMADVMTRKPAPGTLPQYPPGPRDRPMVQGSFHARHFARYGDIAVAYTQRRIESWTPGQPFDLAAEMNELALQIIGKIVFDEDVAGGAAKLRDAVHEFRTYMQHE